MEEKNQAENSVGSQAEKSVDQTSNHSEGNRSEGFDPEEMMKRLKMLEETNQRLVEENTINKNKYREMRDSAEQERKKKLTEEENWKELLDIEKNRAQGLEQTLSSMKKQVLREKLHFEVARHAKDAYDIQDVINALPRDSVTIDEDSLKVDGIGKAIQYLKEKKSYLFDTKKSSGQPSSRPSAMTGNLSYDELSKEEKDKMFKDALGAF